MLSNFLTYLISVSGKSMFNYKILLYQKLLKSSVRLCSVPWLMPAMPLLEGYFFIISIISGIGVSIWHSFNKFIQFAVWCLLIFNFICFLDPFLSRNNNLFVLHLIKRFFNVSSVQLLFFNFVNNLTSNSNISNQQNIYVFLSKKNPWHLFIFE